MSESVSLNSQVYEGVEKIATLDGSENVVYWVPEPAFQVKTISANGTYYPDAGYTGISEVTVNVPSGSGNDVWQKIVDGTIAGEISDDDLNYVKPYAFANCLNLTLVSFPACTSIGEYAFQSCAGLTSVNFPVCEYIGYGAFETCSSLTLVNFPACTNIGSSAFRYCYSLTSVSFPVCTSIGDNTFQQCFNLTSASFPACISIGRYAFYDCYSLAAVNFPVCTSIESCAFEHCNRLTSVNFPACTSVGTYAFYYCSSLATANFPVCTRVGNSAFASCFKLLSLYLLASSRCTLFNTNAFLSTPIAGYTQYTDGQLGSIYVPASLVDAYKSAANWSYYSDRITAYTG